MVNHCCICMKDLGYVDHICIHYRWIPELGCWPSLHWCFTVSWVLPCLIRKVLLSWHHAFAGANCKVVLEVDAIMSTLDHLEAVQH